MTPVLMGRIQTRLFVLGTVGVFWTLIISPFLLIKAPGQDSYKLAFTIDAMGGGDSGLVATYKLTFTSLAIVAIFGCIFWEPVYHFLMQFRWEKDWPAFFHLMSVFPECLTTFLLLHVNALNPLDTGGLDPKPFVPVPAFLFLFFTTWIITWLAANGPMKIFFIRWRFFGGRLI